MYNFKFKFEGKEYKMNENDVEKVFLVPINEEERKKRDYFIYRYANEIIKTRKRYAELAKRIKNKEGGKQIG